MKFTPQEQSILNYLQGKDYVSWQELAQFAKDPQTVKLRTTQKSVSDLRKKYADQGEICPFANVSFGNISLFDKLTPVKVPMSEVYKELGHPSTWESEAKEYKIQFSANPQSNVDHPAMIDLFATDAVLDMVHDKKITSMSIPTQTLVKVKPTRPATGLIYHEEPKSMAQGKPASQAAQAPSPAELPAHRDFKLEKSFRRVRTKNGAHELRDQEWEIFTHLWNNAEKMVTLDDLRNLIWKNWGSKTPPSWADSISRSLTALRKSIPELKQQNRLLTITGQTTAYMLR